jgi:hypothetical protein
MVIVCHCRQTGEVHGVKIRVYTAPARNRSGIAADKQRVLSVLVSMAGTIFPVLLPRGKRFRRKSESVMN